MATKTTRKTFSATETDWLKGNGVAAAVAKLNGAEAAEIRQAAENQIEKISGSREAALAVVREEYKATLERLQASAARLGLTLGGVKLTYDGGFVFVIQPAPRFSQTASPTCGQCGGEMVERVVKKEGPNQGRKFKCCSNGCKGVFRWVA